MNDDLSYQSLIETVPTMMDALERCYLMKGLKPKAAAYLLDIDYCHFQRMFSHTGNRHFPPELIEKLMRVSGNMFPLDWLERRMGRCAYPLEFMQILAEIRKSLQVDGRVVQFALRDRG